MSGNVVRLSDGDPLQGAEVTAAGPGQTPLTVTTGADGRFSIDVAGPGPFGVGVRADGFASQSVAGVQQAAEVPQFAMPPATFEPLPIDVGPTNAVAADPTSGIFYTLMVGAPELYRTVDYGGSWQQVTPSYDDADEGLRNNNSRNLLATSSVPGEVAVASDAFGASVSTDFGLTWKRVTGPDFFPKAWAPRRDPILFWGHASPGSPSTLLFAEPNDDGSWNVWRADGSSADPTWVKEPSDPFGTDSEFAGADSRTGSFIGRVSGSGALSFAPLTPGGPLSFGPDEASGLPSPPAVVQLGGVKEEAAPPAAALVVGGGGPQAQMLTKAAGAAGFAGASMSAATAFPGHCLNQGGADRSFSSIAPTSVGTTGAGSLERCWLKKDGANPLDFPASGGGVSNRAYDAGWGQDNFVAFIAGFTFAGGANIGPFKYGRLNAEGAPNLEFEPATGGTDPESGGYSVAGLTSAPVSDTAYGPGGAGEQAVALKSDSLASRDGGQTMTPILPRGGEWSNAVQWWRGASGDWLLFGHSRSCGGADENMLTGILNWDGTSTLADPNVAGSKCADLGGPGGGTDSYGITSLQPVPGTDTVFLGLGGLNHTDPHHLYRAALVPGNPPSLSGATAIDGPAGLNLTNSVAAMAYCPSTGGDSDVLFVALGALYEHGLEVPGGLVRITGASGGSPSAAYVDSIPHEGLQTGLADVKADCDSGTVYAGGYDGIAGVQPGSEAQTAFFKSTDGGRTFTPITIPDPQMPEIGEVTAVGLDPTDANSVEVAADTTGKILHSDDGGSSWTIVNDPSVARTNRVNDIEYPPSGGGLRSAAVVDPLVGTDGGAFLGDVTATEGVLGLRTNLAGDPGLAARISTLAADDHPLALSPTSSPGAVIFHRSNGLAYSAISGGNWSVPAPIPSTVAGDDFPAVTTDPLGRIRLAFARSGPQPGVYSMTLDPNGTWSVPKRLSSKAGDTMPSIATVGGKAHVVFVRGRGGGRGLWHVAAQGKPRKAKRVPGTGKPDTSAALGGPSLAGAGKKLELALARAGKKAGIYHVSARGNRWSRAKRLTKSKGDAQPSLAIGAKSVKQIVYTSRRGLFALSGKRKFSKRQVKGTTRGDTDPALTGAGSSLALAFARTAGATPGIHYSQATAKGRWNTAPRRLSANATDGEPSLRIGGTGSVTVVFDRG